MNNKRKKIILLINTIKYLRFSQIYFRVYYHFFKLKVSTYPDGKKKQWKMIWSAPLQNSAPIMLSLQKVYCLGEEGELNSIKDWNNSLKSKLWLYQLHYLDDLNKVSSKDPNFLNQLILKWINENPPFYGNGWEPYPISLRLVNMVKWCSKHCNELPEAVLNSLNVQADALYQRLEFHIAANHLFVNAKALIFIGAFLDGERAKKWLDKGLNILDRELKEQFLKDGGHFELSPMYHASLLWDLCDLVQLANCSDLPELKKHYARWVQQIKASFQWLELMCHPDNEISFFNDAAFSNAPTLQEIKQYLEILNISVPNHEDVFFTLLRESGYGVIQFNQKSKAILDIGEVGASYQPGHAHADSLSFELSIDGQRVIVNSGTSEYGEGEERQRQRGTKAHNTVIINHENSSEIWAGFRVARRAHPKDLSIESNQYVKPSLRVTCSHTGYLRLPNKNIHRREFIATNNQLNIHDQIIGAFDNAEARFYFHPKIQLQQIAQNKFQCIFLEKNICTFEIEYAKEILIASTTWHPYFGQSIKNNCLVVIFDGQELLTEIRW